MQTMRRGAEHQVETEPEVDAHGQRREDDGPDGFLLQLAADLRADRLLIEHVERAEEGLAR